jgi:hypothetical protein
MSDPKKAADEPKTTELSGDELDAVTGGAIDSYVYFQNFDGTLAKDSGEAAGAATPAGGSGAPPGAWNRVKN